MDVYALCTPQFCRSLWILVHIVSLLTGLQSQLPGASCRLRDSNPDAPVADVAETAAVETAGDADTAAPETAEDADESEGEEIQEPPCGWMVLENLTFFYVFGGWKVMKC